MDCTEGVRYGAGVASVVWAWVWTCPTGRGVAYGLLPCHARDVCSELCGEQVIEHVSAGVPAAAERHDKTVAAGQLKSLCSLLQVESFCTGRSFV